MVNKNRQEYSERLCSRVPGRVLVVDGWPIFQTWLAQELKNCGMAVSARLASAREVFAVPDPAAYDLAIVDVNLADESGFEVGAFLKKINPRLALIMLCDQDWDIYLAVAWAVGAGGVLIRSGSASQLADILRNATTEPEFAPAQIDRIQNWQATIGATLKNLKKGEWLVLRGILHGKTNREIAEKTGLSAGTVEKYLSRIMDRFSIRSRSALAVFCLKNRLEVLDRLSPATRDLVCSK